VQELPKSATLRGAAKHKFHAKTAGHRTQNSSVHTNAIAFDTVGSTGSPILKDNLNDRAKVKDPRRDDASSIRPDVRNRIRARETARPVIRHHVLWLQAGRASAVFLLR